jgi:flagellar biosynthesis component FlhA
MAKKKSKKKMKKSTRSVLKILISIIYIVWGIYSPIQAFEAVIALDVGAIISAAVGVLTLLAGIFGLFGMEKDKCRLFGTIIFIFSLIGVVTSIPAFPNINVSSLITAILAWLFILCVK